MPLTEKFQNPPSSNFLLSQISTLLMSIPSLYLLRPIIFESSWTQLPSNQVEYSVALPPKCIHCSTFLTIPIDTVSLFPATIISCLDHYKSLLIHLPASILDLLQSGYNTKAGIIHYKSVRPTHSFSPKPSTHDFHSVKLENLNMIKCNPS